MKTKFPKLEVPKEVASVVVVGAGSKKVCPGAGLGATGFGFMFAGAIGNLLEGAIGLFP